MNKSFVVVALVFVSFIAVADIATRGGDPAQIQVNSQRAVSTTVAKGMTVPDPVAAAAERLADKTRPRGTTFGPHPKAEGRLRDIMTEIGRQFALQDPAPPAERLEHFAPLFANYRVNGWHGVIDEVAADGKGWRVNIRVFPHLASESETIVSTTKHYIETYYVENGVLNYLGGVAPQGVMNYVFTD